MTNLQIFCEWTKGISIKQLATKLGLSEYHVKVRIDYGREESRNTKYWQNFLKPLLES